jgi:hypothetical protein
LIREVTRNSGPGERQDARPRGARKQPQPAAPPVTGSGHGRDPQAVQDFTESTELLLVTEVITQVVEQWWHTLAWSAGREARGRL